MKKKVMYEAPSTDVVGVRMNAKILSGSVNNVVGPTAVSGWSTTADEGEDW